MMVERTDKCPECEGPMFAGNRFCSLKCYNTNKNKKEDDDGN